MKEMLWHKHNWPKEVKKTLQYPEEPLFKILDKAAKEAGGKPYTVYSGISQTFAEVNENANRIANFLQRLGIKKGDRVAIYMPNTPHYPPAFFGILKAGACYIPLDPLAPTDRQLLILNDCSLEYLISSSKKLFQIRKILQRKNFLSHIILLNEESDAHLISFSIQVTFNLILTTSGKLGNAAHTVR